MKIGEKIRKRRKELKMTQADLSEGICTQAMVSRIEKKKVKPSRELMEKLAERLAVSLHYFYGEDSVESRYSKTSQLSRLIRQHLERREYESVSYLISSNEELISQAIGQDRMFFEWINGLLYAYRDGESDKALRHLLRLEEMTKNGELRIEIIDSIGNQYLRQDNYELAEKYYQKGFSIFSEWMNYEKKAKLLLNYSVCLAKQNKYNECINKVFQGLSLVISENTLFLLGDFLYYKGYCLEKLGQKKDGLRSYKKARTIFDIQKNENYAVSIQLIIDRLEKELAEND
ncbi:MAG: helix-turn-helix transcriptional regulator [Alkalibacterium sp.]|uniref:Tetratricopeptide repeat-containing protein n=2 Tax=Alkalibacterium gilvum TaxID=1130080 RepID=A0A1H6TU61_9LACT|nr:helix-turn-helix domain-containing protein [Alkalibacterium gilvum]MDN6729827.1 helix-turn-helix transcriptional regulator [Alkalibacterium sp.]SEI83603.1 Tetratricopeptide repeat-containing protein [Alkalibacterium gilvum]